ncbi:MAG: HNH endonuclease signature motif containing protein [Sphingomonas sp.]
MGRLKSLPPRLGGSPVKLRAMPKTAMGFYQSPEWRGLVADLKRMRGNWCERCGSRRRVAGDHIVELADGGAALDEKNVELLCAACHNRKTAKARAERAAGLR